MTGEWPEKGEVEVVPETGGEICGSRLSPLLVEVTRQPIMVLTRLDNIGSRRSSISSVDGGFWGGSESDGNTSVGSTSTRWDEYRKKRNLSPGAAGNEKKSKPVLSSRGRGRPELTS